MAALKALLPKAEHRAWACGGWGKAVCRLTSGAVSLGEVQAEVLCVSESCDRHRIGAEEKCGHIHRLNTQLWKAKGKCQHFYTSRCGNLVLLGIAAQGTWQGAPCCSPGKAHPGRWVGGEKPRHNHHVLWREAEETKSDSCPRGASG